MKNAAKTYVYSKARNTRIAFLVNDDTPVKLIRKIITANYRIWGGTYNPIVPVGNEGIDPGWAKILEQIDPDVIYHVSSVNPSQLIRDGLRIFPREYFEIPENGMLNLQGVNPLSFIDHFFRNNLAERRHVHLPYFHGDLRHPVRDFLELNLGVRELFIADDEYLQEIRSNCLYEGNIDKALSESWSTVGFVQSVLCNFQLGNEILRSDRWQTECFELIVYDKDNAFDDLIYFWNRQLYQTPSTRLGQIAISSEEFNSLANDPFFHQLLYHHAGKERIYVSSRSIDEAPLQALNQQCNSNTVRVELKVVPVVAFPESFGEDTYYEQHNWARTLFQSNEGLINIPDYPVGEHLRLKGAFELDLRINYEGKGPTHIFKFPYFTLLRNNICDAPSRINKRNGLSVQAESGSTAINLRIPSMSDLLISRIQIRDVARKIESPTGLKGCQPSRAGLLLGTFMAIFENDWNFIRQLALDKFWLEVFTGNGKYEKIEQKWQLQDGPTISTGKSSAEKLHGKLAKGDGIFSLKDLHYQLCCIYNVFAAQISEREGYASCSDDTDDTMVKSSYRKDQESILQTIKQFTKLETIFAGMKVSCKNCGSNLWYSLQELSHRMTCKGCTAGISPTPESPFYYKVNDIVLNNLMADPVKRNKAFGGNYLVLRVLGTLRDPVAERFAPSFGYAPSMDIFLEGQKFDRTDLDIIAIQDGKLIVGEAKLNGSGFDEKQIKQLIWIGNEICPDVVLLAYQNGTVSEKTLDQVRQGITRRHVAVQGMKIDQAIFQFGLMRGLK